MLSTLRRYSEKLILPLAILIGPAMLYPSFYLVTFVKDSLSGDRVISYHFLYISKKEIWSIFWSDWAASLFVLYLLVVPQILLSLALRAGKKIPISWSLSITGLLSGSLVSFFYFGSQFLDVLLISSLIFTLPAAWIISSCVRD